MKQYYLKALVLLMLSQCVMLAKAAEDNDIRSSEVNVTKGTSEVDMSIFMTNSMSICGYEFYLQLPEGVSIKFAYDEEEEEDRLFIANGGRARTSHVLSCTKQQNGEYYIFCYDPDNKNFYDSDTKKSLPLITMTLSIDPSVEEGTYDVVVKDKIMNHNNEENIIEEVKPAQSISKLIVKAPAEVKKTTSNNIATFTSVSDAILTASEYQEYVKTLSGLTAVDLRSAVISEDITIEDLRSVLDDNAIVLLPLETDLAGINCVKDGVCPKLVLSDNSNFKAPIEFVATEAEYERTINGFGTICLPFAPSTDGFEYYELSSYDDKTLNFVKVNSPKSDTPYLYSKIGSSDKIIASNVMVGIAGAETTANGIWTMHGLYSTQVFSTQDDVYAVSQGKLYHNTGTLTMKPFRSYFTCSSSGISGNVAINIDDASNIINLDCENSTNVNIMHNLNGQVVIGDYSGFVIVNGKKYYVR